MVFDIITKALKNKFSVQDCYHPTNFNHYMELKPVSATPTNGYDAYELLIRTEPKIVALKLRIYPSQETKLEASVFVSEYNPELITQEKAIQLLKQLIGIRY